MKAVNGAPGQQEQREANDGRLVGAQNARGNFVKITQRIPVRVLVDNAPPHKPLRVGMSVVTSIKVR